MPITKSAKKALRQSVRRHARNLKRKEAYKKLVGELRKMTTAGKTKEAKDLLPKLYAALDKAAKTNAVKKNKASRLKSRLSRLVAKSVSQ